jgi:hypothetical protein
VGAIETGSWEVTDRVALRSYRWAGSLVSVDYSLKQQGGQWKVDVITEEELVIGICGFCD